MINPLSKLMNFFRYHPDQEPHSFHDQEGRDFTNLPPGCMPIESLYDMDQIPGTSRNIGSQLRIFATPANELVTANRRIGIRAGCGHLLFRTQRMVTPQETEQGIGGVCADCVTEASQLLEQNHITIAQAEEMSLYCTDCASHCQGCLRSNLCIRHTQLFQEITGSCIPLCPKCYERAEKQKFLNKIITTALLPFVGRKRLR